MESEATRENVFQSAVSRSQFEAAFPDAIEKIQYIGASTGFYEKQPTSSSILRRFFRRGGAI